MAFARPPLFGTTTDFVGPKISLEPRFRNQSVLANNFGDFGVVLHQDCQIS